MEWSKRASGFLYECVALVPQASQIHNAIFPGGRKYNVPPPERLRSRTTSAPGWATCTQRAIADAGDFSDGDVTIMDLFDTVLKATREVTATCELSDIWP